MTTYSKNTNEKVIAILENAIDTRKRVRVFYGDTKNGPIVTGKHPEIS